MSLPTFDDQAQEDAPPAGSSLRMLQHAGRIAYIVQTSRNPDAAKLAVADIPPRIRDNIIIALANMIDLDQQPRNHAPITTRPLPTWPSDEALHQAHVTSLQPLWEAFRYGDRDPAVIRGWHEYTLWLNDTAAAQKKAA